MVETPGPSIPPVLVLGTGRCGSTMVSNLLNAHPRILSLSEFFSYVGMDAFRLRNPTGDQLWQIFSTQRPRTRLMLRESYQELLYPVDGPGQRFSRHDVPPILCATLPHLTNQHEALYDELESFVRAQPQQPTLQHFRNLFSHLCQRFGCQVWAERSGLTLLVGTRLLRQFPEARVIHIYRDGRETALSMSRHYLFRMIVATFKRLRMFRFFLAAIPLMSKGGPSENIASLMEAVIPRLVRYETLPFDKLKIADFAAFWNALITLADRMLGELPPSRLLSLKLEDIQAEPESHVRRLVRFIDPALEDEEWIRKASAIPRPTPSRFQTLEPQERAAVTAACRPGLDRLGYPV